MQEGGKEWTTGRRGGLCAPERARPLVPACAKPRCCASGTLANTIGSPREKGALRYCQTRPMAADEKDASKKDVSYWYDESIGMYSSVEANILKPHILRCALLSLSSLRASPLLAHLCPLFLRLAG